MRRARVAIDAAVFAAAIWIHARTETDVRATVLADDTLAMILQKLRARQHVVVGIPFRIRFKVD